MDLAKNVNTFISMLTLKTQGFRQAGKADFPTAVVNFFLAALAAGIGAFLMTFEVLGLIGAIVFGTISFIIGYFIAVFIFWGLARLLGGRAQYMQHYTGASYLALLIIPTIIPFIGPFLAGIASLWGIVMHIFLVKEIHVLSTGRAVAAVLIPYAILLLIAVVLVVTAFALFAGAAGLGFLNAI